MPRQQPVSTFVVPEAASRPVTASNAQKRDAKPFVIVPESMVLAEDKLEPHWLRAIDAATD